MLVSRMQDKLDRIIIVLVEPQEGANVGSVCRAMKTMGISRLSIVGRRRSFFEEERVYTLAVHAKDIYESARFTDTLEEALSGSVLSAGVTRRRGKYRKYFSYPPEQFAQKAETIAEGDICLVFGRESSGLRDEELNRCSTAVHIPSSPRFPSLNLAHAVQVCTYACYRTFGDSPGQFTPVPRERVQELTTTVLSSLDKIDFFKQNEREELERYFSDIFTRASLSHTESLKMEKIFRKLPGFLLRRQPPPR
ncbi:MAG: RNA methyltransferase [Spirochaetaceae bacterium]